MSARKLRATQRRLDALPASSYITAERNKPRTAAPYPLSHFEPHVRAAIFQRRAWEAQRDERLRVLCEAMCRGDPGADYLFYSSMWVHLHPYNEWPEYWAEQREFLKWAHLKAGVIWNDWPLVGVVLHPWLKQKMRKEPGWFARQAGAIFFRLRGNSYSSVAAPIPGAFAVDVQNLSGIASDSNNGIWDGGGPWLTWARFRTALEAGTFGLGTTAYMRAGTYVLAAGSPVRPTGGGTVLSASKVHWRNWPGERPMLDMNTNNDLTMGPVPGTGQFGICIRSANYRVQGLDYTTRRYGFGVENGVQGKGCEFIDLRRTRAGNELSAGNIDGVIVIDDGSNNNDFIIEGCDLRDGNQISGNGNTIYVIHATGIIRNNFIGGFGVSGYPLHIKRMNFSSVLGNLTIAYNVIGRGGTNGGGCIYYNNTQYGLIQHNCFSASGGLAMYGSDTGEPSNFPWYRNQLRHNTCRGTPTNQEYGLCGIDNNGVPGNSGLENIVEDNVMTGQISIMANQPTKTHNNVFNWNLYDVMPANLAREFSSNFSNLAAWQANTQWMAAHDGNSIEESIPWNAALIQFNPQTYRLGASSGGINSAQDGTNRGANVDLAGPGALGY